VASRGREELKDKSSGVGGREKEGPVEVGDISSMEEDRGAGA
jgi:hypothetical protein